MPKDGDVQYLIRLHMVTGGFTVAFDNIQSRDNIFEWIHECMDTDHRSIRIAGRLVLVRNICWVEKSITNFETKESI